MPKLTDDQLNMEIEMLFVEGGTYKMGDELGDLRESCRPIHNVTLSDFHIGKYPVTQEEYMKVIGDNPSSWKENYSPVAEVSWYEAVKFCNSLSELKGLKKCYTGQRQDTKCDFESTGYRLPTEAEWEYAAREGKQSRGYKYSGSNNIDHVAWYRTWDNMISVRRTCSVGVMKANKLGIYDMSGNIFEWCNDWYDKHYYEKSPSENPTGASSGTSRAYRGGSLLTGAEQCRVAYRASDIPTSKYGCNGFRVVRSVR